MLKVGTQTWDIQHEWRNRTLDAYRYLIMRNSSPEDGKVSLLKDREQNGYEQDLIFNHDEVTENSEERMVMAVDVAKGAASVS